MRKCIEKISPYACFPPTDVILAKRDILIIIIIIFIIFIFLNPRKKGDWEKIKKSRKRFEVEN